MPLYSYGTLVTAGNSATPSTAFNFSGLNTDNEIARSLVMPATGTIVSVSVYMAGHTAAVTARGVVWDNAGTILTQSGSGSVAQGSGAVGGQVWTTFTVTAVAVASGTTIWIGFWRDPAKDAEWSVAAAGNFNKKSDTSGAPGSFSGSAACGVPYTCHDIGAYITYRTAVQSTPPSPGDASW